MRSDEEEAAKLEAKASKRGKSPGKSPSKFVLSLDYHI
jgi:hypothetical protein